MKFGFIGHAREIGELRKAFLLLHNISTIPFRSGEVIKSKALEEGLIRESFTYRKIYSHQDTDCSGKVLTVFLTPEQLLENQVRAVELVVQACWQAKQWGAEIIGLGAVAAVIGSRGREVNENSPVPVTTGNSLMVYSTLKVFHEVVRKLEVDLSRQKVVIVGFPGSVALAVTRALLKEGLKLIVVGRGQARFVQRFLSEIDDTVRRNVEVTRDLSDALSRGRIIFTATTIGNLIDPDRLQPGSIVFDIAQPRDVINKKKKRKDVLIIDAETASLPRTNGTTYHSVYLPFLSFIPVPIRAQHYSGLFGIGPYYIPSCLAETITLALEERRESFSLGRELNLDRVKEIGALSEKHGFDFNCFFSFEKEIGEENFVCTKKALQKLC